MKNRISNPISGMMKYIRPFRCVFLMGVFSACIDTGWAVCADHATDQNVSAKTKAVSAMKETEKLKQDMLTLAHELVTDFPKNSEVRIWLGNAHRLNGQTDRALQILEEVLQANPKRLDLLYILGQTAFDQEEYDKAITYWRRALAVGSNLPEFNLAIGEALLEKGEIDDAIDALKRELEISTRSGKAFYLLGQCHLQLEEYEKARQYYLQAVKIAPDNSTLYFGLFTACRRLQRMTEAAEYMEKFKSMKKDILDEHREGYSQDINLDKVQTGAVMMLLGASDLYRQSNNLPRAGSLLEWAVRLEPENIKALRKQVMLYQMSGRFQEALDIADKMRTLEPGNPEHYHAVGLLAFRLRQVDKAEQAFLAVKNMVPDKAIGYRELARLYLSAGIKLPLALELAQQSLALEESPSNYYLLSWACARNGQKQQALVAAKKALDLAPDNPQYRQLYEQMLRQE